MEEEQIQLPAADAGNESSEVLLRPEREGADAGAHDVPASRLQLRTGRGLLGVLGARLQTLSPTAPPHVQRCAFMKDKHEPVERELVGN